MSGLVLKLAPNERVLINGAVIENGDRRSKIAIRTPNANVLRRDARFMRATDGAGPADIAVHAQMFLAVDAGPENGRLLGGDVHQPGDGVARAGHGETLQGLADCE